MSREAANLMGEGAAVESRGKRMETTDNGLVADQGDSKPRSLSPQEAKPKVADRASPAAPSEPAAPPKVSRKSTAKSTATRDLVLYSDLPNMTEDAVKTFQCIPDCLYGSKNIGSAENDALDCDCRDEWEHGVNQACGDDASCINRATKMECLVGSGNCRDGCQNQRFQRKQYANVSVIRTDKKGFGLRANVDLRPGDFVFEYIGEVINEPTFRRRMLQYDQEGIKHFYFMSLSRNEFVDATKKGNLGRFCNHSCNPNCYVDKWAVGEKLRMGIFAKTHVTAGEELVFDYNVDRYGAEAQPCYCGETNCVGFIGGKTQSGPTTALSLSLATLEALGLDDGEVVDAPAKKQRKKKPDEDEEEYVSSMPVRGLNEAGARKVMASLAQCKEKWIAVKLLQRIQSCDEEPILLYVMHMHAYRILRTAINTFNDDHNLVLQALNILNKFPRLTRNKIIDSNIEPTIESLSTSQNEQIATASKKLLSDWAQLPVGFRIGRRKMDGTEPATNTFAYEDRRNGDRGQDRNVPSKVSSPVVDAPKGPRSTQPQRNPSFYGSNSVHSGPVAFHASLSHGGHNRGPRPRPLPDGWFPAKDQAGRMYYYTRSGRTTWSRPMHPADGPPPPKATTKVMSEEALYQSIIDEVTKEEPRKSSTNTPQQPGTPAGKDPKSGGDKGEKQEKWRAYPLDKQMKLYESMLVPHIMHVTSRYRSKLPKEELKRLAKDAGKTLVASDYKHGRVGDPMAPINEKAQKKIKQWVAGFLDRAVVKWEAHQKRSESRKHQAEGSGNGASTLSGADVKQGPSSPVDDMPMSEAGTSPGSEERKRKREDGVSESPVPTPSDLPEAKRLKEDDDHPGTPPPPPPPPPAPPAIMLNPEALSSQEQLALREQEEALMRENEEAQRLEDEAALEKDLPVGRDVVNGQSFDHSGDKNLAVRHGNGPPSTGLDPGSGIGSEEGAAPKREVLSH